MVHRFEFDWDPAKAATHLINHDASFEDAMTVFHDPLALSQPDDAHNFDEERWITVGMSRAVKPLLVVHTAMELSEDRTYNRIISARKPAKSERRQYEQMAPEG